MAISGGVSTKKGSNSGAPSPGVNTNICSLLVAYVCSDVNPPTLTDPPYLNTWQRIGNVQAAAFGTSYSAMYWVPGIPIVGGGHTFAPVTGGSSGVVVVGMVGNGPFTLVDYKEAAAQSAPARAGSVTPSGDNQVVIFGCGGFDTTGITMDVVGEVEDLVAVGGVNYSAAIGYLIESAATPANPGVTAGDFTFGVHTAVFKEAAGLMVPSRFARQAVNRAATY